jgi:hypothetical protein
MKLKTLKWASKNTRVSEQKILSGYIYEDCTNDKLFDFLVISRQSSSDPWRVQASFDGYWMDYHTPLCMNLDKDYTLEEVKQIVQDGWEHFILKFFFEEVEREVQAGG